MKPIIDEVRDFWNARPCNIRHSHQPMGTREYFDEVERKRYFVEPHIVDFCEFPRWKGKKVLELGCGIGTDAVCFAREGAFVTMTEISENSIDIAKKRFEVYGLQGKFILCNFEELSSYLPLDSYDLIYAAGTIHHTEYPEKVIKEIIRYCNDDTIIKVIFYSKYSWKALSFYITDGYRFWFNYKKTIQYFAEAQQGCPIANTYSKREVLDLFKDFKVISIKKEHIFSYLIPEYIQGKYKKTALFRYMPASMFQWLKGVLGWHWLIELKLKGG